MKGQVYCRICGNQDNLTYCSQCGLPLDYAKGGIFILLSERLVMIGQPIAQFFVTFFFLLLRPNHFFRILATDGKALNGLQILDRRIDIQKFDPWRRPMTPLGYFVLGSVLFAIASDHFEILNSISESIYSKYFSGDQSNINLFPNIAHNLFFEVTLFLILAIIIYPYYKILGVNRNNLGYFIEYFLYVLVQFFVCVLVLLTINYILDNFFCRLGYCYLLSGILAPITVAIICILSLFYFLCVPLVSLRTQYDLSTIRIVLAFICLLLLKAVLFIALVLILSLLFPLLPDLR